MDLCADRCKKTTIQMHIAYDCIYSFHFFKKRAHFLVSPQSSLFTPIQAIWTCYLLLFSLLCQSRHQPQQKKHEYTVATLRHVNFMSFIFPVQRAHTQNHTKLANYKMKKVVCYWIRNMKLSLIGFDERNGRRICCSSRSLLPPPPPRFKKNAHIT